MVRPLFDDRREALLAIVVLQLVEGTFVDGIRGDVAHAATRQRFGTIETFVSLRIFEDDVSL